MAPGGLVLVSPETVEASGGRVKVGLVTKVEDENRRMGRAQMRGWSSRGSGDHVLRWRSWRSRFGRQGIQSLVWSCLGWRPCQHLQVRGWV